MNADDTLSVFEELVPDPELVPAAGTADRGTTAVPAQGGTAGAGTGTDDAVPALAAPGTGAAVPARGAGTDLVPAEPLQRAGTTTLLLLSLRDRAAAAVADQKRHRTFWHMVWSGLTVQPESFTAHREHIKSRAWLEDWMTGWVRSAFEWQNVLFGYLVAVPVKCACRAAVFVIQNIEKASGRQYRFWLVAPVLAFIIWHLIR